ncbi:MAG: hypothetical protein OES26_25275 [Gammaproteobacteria bacterium]|nr:hypothetical protein [Gammaproteobacteria bacterium]
MKPALISLTPKEREEILRILTKPGTCADSLIHTYLGTEASHPRRRYTTDVDEALSLVPNGVHFLAGRFEGGRLFWCDVGYRPQVQAWGENLASAIASAAFAYLTHPDRGEEMPMH